MSELRIVKNGQWLEIYKGDKMCKYDFATHLSYGFSGKPVKSLHAQLGDIHLDEFVNAITNDKYRRFIDAVIAKEKSNVRFKIATFLQDLSKTKYISMESLYAAGVEQYFATTNIKLSDISKLALKFAKQFNVRLSEYAIGNIKRNEAIFNALMSIDWGGKYDNEFTQKIISVVTTNSYYSDNVFKLINDYNYDVKSLINYTYKLWLFEGITNIDGFYRELADYANMMHRMTAEHNKSYEKYPHNFLTTHTIATRNYNRILETYDDNAFAKLYNEKYECEIDEYTFIFPKVTQDIKNESIAQSNCVSSYIKRMMNNECTVIFMRLKDTPNMSHITIELRDDKPVQYLRSYNQPVSVIEAKVIDKYAKYLKKQFNTKDVEKVA